MNQIRRPEGGSPPGPEALQKLREMPGCGERLYGAAVAAREFIHKTRRQIVSIVGNDKNPEVKEADKLVEAFEERTKADERALRVGGEQEGKVTVEQKGEEDYQYLRDMAEKGEFHQKAEQLWRKNYCLPFFEKRYHTDAKRWPIDTLLEGRLPRDYQVADFVVLDPKKEQSAGAANPDILLITHDTANAGTVTILGFKFQLELDRADKTAILPQTIQNALQDSPAARKKVEEVISQLRGGEYHLPDLQGTGGQNNDQPIALDGEGEITIGKGKFFSPESNENRTYIQKQSTDIMGIQKEDVYGNLVTPRAALELFGMKEQPSLPLGIEISDSFYGGFDTALNHARANTAMSRLNGIAYHHPILDHQAIRRDGGPDYELSAIGTYDNRISKMRLTEKLIEKKTQIREMLTSELPMEDVAAAANSVYDFAVTQDMATALTHDMEAQFNTFVSDQLGGDEVRALQLTPEDVVRHREAFRHNLVSYLPLPGELWKGNDETLPIVDDFRNRQETGALVVINTEGRMLAWTEDDPYRPDGQPGERYFEKVFDKKRLVRAVQRKLEHRELRGVQVKITHLEKEEKETAKFLHVDHSHMTLLAGGDAKAFMIDSKPLVSSEAEAKATEAKKDLVRQIYASAPDNAVITGSIALGFHEGMPLDQAIAKAADVNVLVESSTLPQEGKEELVALEHNNALLKLIMNEGSLTREQFERSIPVQMDGREIRLLHVRDMLTIDIRSLKLALESEALRKHGNYYEKNKERVRRILSREWNGEIEKRLLEEAKAVLLHAQAIDKK